MASDDAESLSAVSGRDVSGSEALRRAVSPGDAMAWRTGRSMVCSVIAAISLEWLGLVGMPPIIAE
ncbi:MAG: hypothetical protein QOI36_1881 [Pseudonocardiales bacterium]|nr:hypothetical protein [Pseudonocardiales bacterium]